MATVSTTPRLVLRELTVEDAAFIADLLNQPSFLRFIGDRQVRSDDDAAAFIEGRYRQSYRDHGFGLYVVADRATAIPMGICGFVRRDTLPSPDIGFAFLPQFEGAGFAREAAQAVLQHGRDVLGLTRVLAIATRDNHRSHRLLTRLGFQRDGEVTMPGETVPVAMFALDLSVSSVPTSSGDATGYASA